MINAFLLCLNDCNTSVRAFAKPLQLSSNYNAAAAFSLRDTFQIS